MSLPPKAAPLRFCAPPLPGQVTSLKGRAPARVYAEFREAERRIGEYGPIVAFRPPGGSISRDQSLFVREAGYPVVAGTIYPLDHLLENETVIEWLARGLSVDGGVLILHDTASRGPRTARVLDRLIPELKKQGYRFERIRRSEGTVPTRN